MITVIKRQITAIIANEKTEVIRIPLEKLYVHRDLLDLR